MEMKVERDAGQGAEHRRAGRVLADVGPTKAPIRTMMPMMNAHARPGLPGAPSFPGRRADRQHDHEDDDEHVRHARPVGHRRDVVAALAFREPQAR